MSPTEISGYQFFLFLFEVLQTFFNSFEKLYEKLNGQLNLREYLR